MLRNPFVFITAGVIAFITTLSHGPVQSDVTYFGMDGVYDQVFSMNGGGGDCESCHSQGAAQIPYLEQTTYDDAAEAIATILIRVNLDPMDSECMPQNNCPLAANLKTLLQDWSDDGVPDISPPQLTVTPASSITFQSGTLAGTMKENGVETNAYFKYWQTGSTEPNGCPVQNSIFQGCTLTTTAPGDGGGDIDYPVSHSANGLNCNTGYTFRLMSEFNGQYFAQSSPSTQAFTTLAGIDTDTDGVCDGVDNCVVDVNADQLDTDGDGMGDACDLDIDGDGVLNLDDNCPLTPNPGQEDTNGNGIGDACETSELCFPILPAPVSAVVICL